ncbi:MAG: hypothetical protein AAB521_02065 [Patescibacteria group bacterium]
MTEIVESRLSDAETKTFIEILGEKGAVATVSGGQIEGQGLITTIKLGEPVSFLIVLKQRWIGFDHDDTTERSVERTVYTMNDEHAELIVEAKARALGKESNQKPHNEPRLGEKSREKWKNAPDDAGIIFDKASDPRMMGKSPEQIINERMNEAFDSQQGDSLIDESASILQADISGD